MLLQFAFIRWILYGLRHHPLKLAGMTAAVLLTMIAIASAGTVGRALTPEPARV